MKIQYLNPRYDAPFKYLLENDEFAKGLIGTIIGQEVVELTPEPQEKVGIDVEPLKLVIYRKDYRAVIKTEEAGVEKLETVKIEMQKSYISPHIDRFREYTGAEYSTPHKIEKKKRKSKTGETKEYVKKHYLPIITIYFIEETFNDQLPSVLRVGKAYYDVLGGKNYVGVKDEFVEILTHEAYFIQIKKLPKELQTDYEVLRIFCGNFVGKDEILMELETDVDIYKDKSLLAMALFMLTSITGDKKMQRKMNEERKFEQTYLENLEQQELLESMGEELQETKGELKETKGELQETKGELKETKGELQETKGELKETKGELQETKGELKETKGELQETKGELKETKGELQETKGELKETKGELQETKGELKETKGELETAKAAILNSARMLKQANIPIEKIQEITGLSKNEIESL